MGPDLGERMRQANVDHDWMYTNVWIQVGILVSGGDWEGSRKCGVVTQWRLCLINVIVLYDDHADSADGMLGGLLIRLSVVTLQLSRWSARDDSVSRNPVSRRG